ncbi:hypothetical protein ACTHO5_04460 [Cytobacillus praedii]|uniref:hypothetical protein n=1 Tax=Cytobacillus praedii TaxID=1742358 RepID=UPI002E1DC480|nr:hypothetical protein [Cytobacillus praedii]
MSILIKEIYGTELLKHPDELSHRSDLWDRISGKIQRNYLIEAIYGTELRENPGELSYRRDLWDRIAETSR